NQKDIHYNIEIDANSREEANMQKFRTLVNLVLVAALGLASLATPLPVVASGMAQLTVTNRTGGSLTVILAGAKRYYYRNTKSGNTIFKNFNPGRYIISVTSSACPGTLTYQRTITQAATLKGFKCVAHVLGTVDQQAATLSVENRAGGTLSVTLKGTVLYSFS